MSLFLYAFRVTWNMCQCKVLQLVFWVIFILSQFSAFLAVIRKAECDPKRRRKNSNLHVIFLFTQDLSLIFCVSLSLSFSLFLNVDAVFSMRRRKNIVNALNLLASAFCLTLHCGRAKPEKQKEGEWLYENYLLKVNILFLVEWYGAFLLH